MANEFITSSAGSAIDLIEPTWLTDSTTSRPVAYVGNKLLKYKLRSHFPLSTPRSYSIHQFSDTWFQFQSKDIEEGFYQGAMTPETNGVIPTYTIIQADGLYQASPSPANW